MRRGRTALGLALGNTNSGYLVPAVDINLGFKFKFATTGFTHSIILFLFLAKPNFCAETSRTLQIGYKFFYFAPMSAR
jgi:hypothetical protein